MPNYPAVALLTAAALSAVLLTGHPAPVEPSAVPLAAPSAPSSAAPVAVPSGATYLPCPTEDYSGPVGCYWDAATRSNGAGFSFFWDGNHTHYQTAGVAPCPSADYAGMQPCYWGGEGARTAFLWTGHGKIDPS